MCIRDRGNTCEQGQEPDLFADLHRRIYERHPKIQSIIMAAPVYAAGYAVTERAVSYTHLMCEGRITGEFDTSEVKITQEEILYCAAGGKD